MAVKMPSFPQQVWAHEMSDATTKSQGRRTLADSFMRDAQRESTPWRSRADLAFEAVYLYALTMLGEQADDYEHPDTRVLTAAAEKCNMTAEEIGPAVEYLAHRFDPAIPDNGSAYQVLLSIAKLLGSDR